MDQRPGLALRNRALTHVGEPGNLTPVRARRDGGHQVHQRVLTLIKSNAVKLWHLGQYLVVTQTRIVPADSEMAGHSGSPQFPRDTPELRQEVLENQRESDDQGLRFREARRNPCSTFAHLHHLNRAPVLLQGGSQVSHSQVALILIADQDDIWTRPPMLPDNGGSR